MIYDTIEILSYINETKQINDTRRVHLLVKTPLQRVLELVLT